MNVARLEKASGDAGIDTRLIGEITETAHRVVRELGLDLNDTTSEELYHALNASVRRNDMSIRDLYADTAFVLINLGAGPISLNMHDIIENAHHELPFEKRSVAHAQRKLRMELVRRYAEHDRTHESFVHSLASEVDVHRHDDAHYVDLGALSMQTESNEPHDGRPYILAIGDIFTDAFIQLNENEARVTKDENNVEWLSVQFGAKMPYDNVEMARSVGPSPNAAVSMSRLGINAGLTAFLGDDEVGKESLVYLATQGVDTSTIQPEAGAKSSYWYVLRYGADRTMLVKNEDYAYKWNPPVKVPDWVYLSQISPSAWGLHEELLGYLEAHPDTKLVFQPGTSHFRWGTEKMGAIYKRAYVTVMNREEAMDVTGKPYDSIKVLADALHALGPKIVVITDGPKGSYASYDGKVVTIPNFPDPAPPYERTGAGDAFASTIVAALALGETMETALTWAPVNSAYVVQKLGAQAGLQTREQILDHLKTAPETYKVTEFHD